jgi:hypothetical protein
MVLNFPEPLSLAADGDPVMAIVLKMDVLDASLFKQIVPIHDGDRNWIDADNLILPNLFAALEIGVEPLPGEAKYEVAVDIPETLSVLWRVRTRRPGPVLERASAIRAPRSDESAVWATLAVTVHGNEPLKPFFMEFFATDRF